LRQLPLRVPQVLDHVPPTLFRQAYWPGAVSLFPAEVHLKWDTMDSRDRRQPSSLAEEQQGLTRDRIRRAAMEVVARQGFDATVDEIAQRSGVSPRTIFRHYKSHDGLIAATVKDMFEACGRYPIEGLPQLVDDLDGWIEGLPQVVDDLDDWIEGLAVTIHTRSARIFGEAFWDIHRPSDRESEALSEVAALRREFRLRGVDFLVTVAWRTAGGTGEPPQDLMLAFALNLSTFTTQALMVDFNQTPAQIGLLTANILKGLLRRAVEAQLSGPGDVSTDVDGAAG
jgi:AcrR family transcriptional regulator